MNYLKSSLRNCIQLMRPFTLIYPFLAVVTSASCAVVALNLQWNELLIIKTLLCGIGASLMNGASNSLNQIADIAIDKVNKPDRPLSSGQLSIQEASIFTLLLYIGAFSCLSLVDYLGSSQCVAIACLTILITYIYSYGPRIKQSMLGSNFVIAFVRGPLLVFLGWACIQHINIVEPILIGTIWGFFLFGAIITKDFADMQGDEQYGCITFPIKLGVEQTAWFMLPFITLPFLFFNLFSYFGWMSGNIYLLNGLGIFLTVWGIYIATLILKDPKALTNVENHPSWLQMYLLMMFGQIGLSIAYQYA